MKGSYKITEFTTNIEAEVHRLKGQVELFFDKEFTKYCALGLQDGMEIIECGSGPGFLIAAIVERFPKCKATALEIDPFLSEISKNNSVKDGKKLYDAIEGSIMDTKLADNRFDIVITRLVIEHLPEPGLALKELYRILKPGGKLFIVSNDFSLHVMTYPHIAELDLLYDAYYASQAAKGGNPRIGRELPQLLGKGNFINIDMDVICAHSALNTDKAFFKAEDVNISSQLVKEGFLGSDVLDTIAKKWYAMLKTEGHAIYRQLCIVSGEKSMIARTPGADTQSKAKTTVVVSAVEPILKAAPGDRPELIKAYLVKTIASVLELESANVKSDVLFHNLGIDSVSAVEFNNSLMADFGLDVAISALLETVTIDALVTQIIPLIDKKSTTPEQQAGTAQEWIEGEL